MVHRDRPSHLCLGGSGGGLGGRDSKKFGVDSKKCEVDSKKCEEDSKKFGADSKNLGRIRNTLGWIQKSLGWIQNSLGWSQIPKRAKKHHEQTYHVLSLLEPSWDSLGVVLSPVMGSKHVFFNVFSRLF